MLAFLDFEASSLSDRSYPIEVGWIFENGASETCLIRPAPGWEDWDLEAEAIHGIGRKELLDRGLPHDEVARRMIEALGRHDVRASAPSWDGKWLSALLRAAGMPRHSLRLRGSDEALREAAREVLAPVAHDEELDAHVAQVLALASLRDCAGPPAHRALADARQERERWLEVRRAAAAVAARLARPRIERTDPR